jgi:hypothetical protein
MARNSSRISRRLAIHCGAVAAVLEGLLPLGAPRDVRLASGTRLFGISTGQSVTPFAAQPALAPVHSQRTAVGAAAGACSEATVETAGQRPIAAISEIYRENGVVTCGIIIPRSSPGATIDFTARVPICWRSSSVRKNGREIKIARDGVCRVDGNAALSLPRRSLDFSQNRTRKDRVRGQLSASVHYRWSCAARPGH